MAQPTSTLVLTEAQKPVCPRHPNVEIHTMILSYNEEDGSKTEHVYCLRCLDELLNALIGRLPNP